MPLVKAAYAIGVTTVATLCLATGCGGSTTVNSVTEPAPVAPVPTEAQTPAPVPDAGAPVRKATWCSAPRAPDPVPTLSGEVPAFFVAHPAPVLQHRGGPILENPRIVPVFFPGDPMVADLEDFVSSVGCTEHWRQAVNEYRVGDAIASAAVHLIEKAPSNISDTQIETWLAAKLKAKEFEAPTPNSVYTIFYPAGTTITEGGATSCEAFGGYHTSITLEDGTPVAYAVIPRCDGFHDLSSQQATTGSASHELIEAATDPYNKDTPAWAEVDDASFAFMFVLGGENADLCAQEPDAFTKPAGYPYTLQRNWSNRSAQRGDPCLPKSGAPFFTAAPTLADSVSLFGATTRGVLVPNGGTKTIDVELYSEDAGATMDVQVMDVTERTGAAGVSTYSLDQTSGKSGAKLRLTITTPQGAASDPELFAVVVMSAGRTRIAWVGTVGH